jgi:hypothetical protein
VSARRPYLLLIDSGDHDEPSPRWFGSLAAVWKAADTVDPCWAPFIEVRRESVNARGGFYWPRIDRHGNTLV